MWGVEAESEGFGGSYSAKIVVTEAGYGIEHNTENTTYRYVNNHKKPLTNLLNPILKTPKPPTTPQIPTVSSHVIKPNPKKTAINNQPQKEPTKTNG